MNLLCKKSGSGGCTKVQQKGKDEYAIEFVHQQVKQMGWTTIACKCDPENSTHLIVEELAKKGNHPTIPRETTKGSKGSLSHREGSHTWTESQIRTLLIGLRKRYPGVVIHITDDVISDHHYIEDSYYHHSTDDTISGHHYNDNANNYHHNT